MTPTEIKQLHEAGDVQKLAEAAATILGVVYVRGYWYYDHDVPALREPVNDMSVRHVRGVFATDLTSAAGFEKQCMPEGYGMKLSNIGDDHTAWIFHRTITPETYMINKVETVVNKVTNKHIGQVFSGPSEALNRCAATLYAIAHEGEQWQVTIWKAN